MKKKFDIKQFIADSIYDCILDHPCVSFNIPHHSTPFIEVYNPSDKIAKLLRELSESSKEFGFRYHISVECIKMTFVTGRNSVSVDKSYFISMPNNKSSFKDIMQNIIHNIHDDMQLRYHLLNEQEGGVK